MFLRRSWRRGDNPNWASHGPERQNMCMCTFLYYISVKFYMNSSSHVYELLSILKFMYYFLFSIIIKRYFVIVQYININVPFNLGIYVEMVQYLMRFHARPNLILQIITSLIFNYFAWQKAILDKSWIFFNFIMYNYTILLFIFNY